MFLCPLIDSIISFLVIFHLLLQLTKTVLFSVLFETEVTRHTPCCIRVVRGSLPGNGRWREQAHVKESSATWIVTTVVAAIKIAHVRLSWHIMLNRCSTRNSKKASFWRVIISVNVTLWIQECSPKLLEILTPEQAMKAQRGSRVIALLFLVNRLTSLTTCKEPLSVTWPIWPLVKRQSVTSPVWLLVKSHYQSLDQFDSL